MPEKKKRVYKIARGSLFRCWTCPREHPGWMRSQLRKYRGRDYCIPHRPQHKKEKPCPKCGNEWGYFKWGGSIAKTVVVCEVCGNEAKAQKYYNDLDIDILSSPIERR